MCALGSCEFADVQLPVAELLSHWHAALGSPVANATQPVFAVGRTVYVRELPFMMAEIPGGRSTCESRILKVLDSPTWLEKITRVRWIESPLVQSGPRKNTGLSL